LLAGFGSLNFVPFSATLVLLPIFYGVPKYVSIIFEAKIYNVKYEDDDVIFNDKNGEYQERHVIRNISLIGFILFVNYLNKRNLAITVIDQHMASKKQTQLSEFLMKHKEPTLVTTKTDEQN
jgi:hypothetical protein